MGDTRIAVEDRSAQQALTHLQTRIEALETSGATATAKLALMKTKLTAFAISNVTTDRTQDADATTLAEEADVVGTLIADLLVAVT